MRLTHIVRRLDNAAESYEAMAETEDGVRAIDRVISLLLCLWLIIQIGVLIRFLHIFPLL